MTREEQIKKFDAMAKPRSKEVIAKAEERKRKREADLLNLPMARDEEAERAAKRFRRKYPLTEGTLKAIGVSQESAAHYQEGCFLRGVEWADKSMLDKVSQWLDDNLERYVLEGRNGKPYISVALTEDLRRAMEGD